MARDEPYQRAERKIEEARRLGAKKLDLSGMKVTELPESLGQLTLLQGLYLSYSGLTALPESLGQLTQLQRLDLSNNHLAMLPERLGELTQLQTLNLSNNQLTALPESLGQLTQLQRLDLSNNQLTALPESLGELTQLQTLSLSNNQLTALPEWMRHLTQLQTLDLESNQLAALPEWMGHLTQLQTLDLESNQLAALPEWMGRLTQLQTLILSDNRLTAVPEWLGGLTQLRTLDLSKNLLAGLPESIHSLRHLTYLYIQRNRLGRFPDEIRGLIGLEELYIWRNGLSEVPNWIRDLRSLAVLSINGNEIKDLPPSVAELSALKRLILNHAMGGNNPLNPALAAANEEGFDAVMRYLRELASGARERYEAKLLILGDGNEGKTCVSRALRDMPFREQKTTRGVDVVQWRFAHPDHSEDREKDITLNIWDFEGQEISHQTHQFFLTSQSLYLLVFKCRDQFLLDRAEYWLDTIRARAPKAKVAIVISQCEGRMPLVPLDRIQAQHSDLLAKEWFFPVGCKDKSNIPKLRSFLQRWVADLEFMGFPWPLSYEKAETDLKGKSKHGTASITRKKLYAAFRKAGVSNDGYEDAAAAMARLGVITQFADCPDLRDFVVLRPQWLTKAISKVMEDKRLSADQGEIALERMEGMWKKEYPGMFATFHHCMKEFELCYDLEDNARSCLVPLRFGYLRPSIPWSDSAGLKVRRIEYKLNIRPPMGIMSRFIVKTHHMIVKTDAQPKGVYWHNGVFLHSGDGALRSEALCEFDPEERKLSIEVRAAYPQNMCEQIHAYVRAVFSFFSGLEAERSYGCISVDSGTGAEERCSGVHSETKIYTLISMQEPTFVCEFGRHRVDPRLLVGGFPSFNQFVMAKVVPVDQLREELREQLDKPPEWAAPFLRGVGSLLDWVSANGGKMDQLLEGQSALSAVFRQEAELKLQEYLALTSKMLDDRDFTAAPGLISVNTKDRSMWNPTGYFKQTYVLTPYCECKDNIHACDDGCVEFTKDQDWWVKTAPWVARGTRLLSAGITLAVAGMPLVLGSVAYGFIKDDLNFMGEMAKHMEWKQGDKKPLEEEDPVAAMAGKGVGEGDKESRLARAALAGLLEELAPANYRARQWGSLRRVRMSDDSYRWLCAEHAAQAR